MPHEYPARPDRPPSAANKGAGDVALPAWRLEAFSSLVGEIYEAAASADSFDPVLQDLATLIGADVTALYCWDKAAATCEPLDKCVMPIVNGASTDWLADLVNDNRPLPYCRGTTDGLVFSDEPESPGELDRWESALTWVFDDALIALAIVVARRSESGAFTSVDKRIFSELRPHLSRAMSLCRMVQSHEWNKVAGLEALDHLHTGVVIVDGHGHVYFANLAAESLCRNGQGLRLSRRGISATHSAANEALQAAIRDVYESAESGFVANTSVVSISRADSQAPLVVSCLPVPGEPQLLLPNQPRVILMLRDPDSHLGDDESVLESLYGLTHGESRVALGIADGVSITQLAHDLHASDTTVRNTLKRVFQKTYVHSQAELASLVGKTLLP